jgi:putative inorganic carbon (HCO3(-)) transporter
MIKSPETYLSFKFLLAGAISFIGLIAVSLVLGNDTLIMSSYLLAFSLPFIYLLFFQLHLLVFLTVLAIPLSVKLTLSGGVAISLPAELLAGIIAVFYIVYRLMSPVSLDAKIFRHPITILILLDISWLVLTTLFSELPVISIKRIAVRLAFMTVFFFIFSVLFTDFRNITRVWILYGLGLVIPVFWTIYSHSQFGFVKAVSYLMPKPFYNDHTQYATCIAYILPVLGVVIAMPEKFGVNRNLRILLLLLAIVLCAGELFSFSRAAWLSIILAVIVSGLVVFFRFRLVHFMLLTVLAGALIYHYRTEIYLYIEKVDSVSRSVDVGEHMESVMNIQTDASNLERINRWQCALRMFRDRPLLGFGPGTYQFVYGKYQITPERTRISTNHGEKGNAHSEYLTYLSETGLPGFIIFNLLLLVSFYTAIKIFRESRRKEVRWLTVAIMMGFITYFFHGLFNSFIDTDKASVLVYGSLAALVTIDLYHKDGGSSDSGQGIRKNKE